MKRYKINLSTGVSHVVCSDKLTLKEFIFNIAHTTTSHTGWIVLRAEIEVDDMMQVVDMGFKIDSIVSVVDIE